MKKNFILWFWILCAIVSNAQVNKSFALYLIGDAGEDTISGDALLLLKEELMANPNSAVVFLGDNVYPNGLKQNHVSEMHLISQLQILKEYVGQVCFVPGNHDWDGQKASGLKTLKNEEVFVEDYLNKNSSIKNKSTVFLPKGGLPGPATMLINPGIRLICIDTQWFLHFYKKSTLGTKKQTKALFYERLDSLLNLSKQNNEQVIMVAHHPMFSNGQHSKRRQPMRFLVNYTPFQFFGLMGLNRLYSQDIPQHRYKVMRKNLLKRISLQTNMIYASGHDHNLQVFEKGGNRFIVSGSGSKLSKLCKRKREKALFEDDSKTGFVKLEFGEKTIINVFRVGTPIVEVK